MDRVKLVGVLSALCLAAACRSAATPRATGSAAGDNQPPSVMARLDGQPILSTEVDATVRGPLARADAEYRQGVYDLRKQALGELIDAKLVARQARAQGVTEDQLLDREVKSKVAAPTDAELHAVYDQAKAQGQELPPFDDIKDEVVKFVRQEKMRQALDDYHQRLRASAKIEVLVPPLLLPRVAVDASGPSLGAADAPVTIVAFSDYECPVCRRAEPSVKSVLEAYGGKVRLVYREFPLPNHPHAQKASEAALCAHDQGKYWQMQEKLFANQQALAVENLKSYARAIGLDGARFDHCLDGGDKVEAVAASIRAGDQAGVGGTPAFFINGRPLTGVASPERFKEIIDAELAGSAGK